MMFGHLKAEDFVNLIEGGELPAGRKSHLEGCAPCRARWAQMSAIHAEVSALDKDIPEPDWAEFRSAVRNRLLSRSVRRDSLVRRWTGWTGWTIQPAAAWALSVFVGVVLTTAALLWNMERTSSTIGAPEGRALQSSAETNDLETVRAIWPQTALFDDLIQLGDTEEEQLRQMLESAQKITQ